MYCEFSHWYDKMMHSVDYDKWASYISDFLNGYRCKTVLECGCGTGNISLRLAKQGFSVIASDLSETMLMEARNKMMKAGLRFPMVQQDMRTITVHKPLDAVISVCDGVNYLVEDTGHFFVSAYNALKPGGILLFDLSSHYKLSRLLNKTSFSDVGKDWAYICDNFFEEASNLLTMELTYFVKDGNFYTRYEEQHVQRGFYMEEIKEMLVECGFTDIQCFDCFTRDKANDTSERIQFLAVKPAEG